MIISLRYNELSGTINSAKKMANTLDKYCDKLTRQVRSRIYSDLDGLSPALESANYYIEAKLKELRRKEAEARTLVSSYQRFIEIAKETDISVASKIESSRVIFFEKYGHLEPSKFKKFLISFTCELKDVPFFSLLIKIEEKTIDAIDCLTQEIRYWYECNGGRELISVAISFAKLGISVALYLLVPVGGFISATFLLANVVYNVIKMVNNATNIATSIRAYSAVKAGEPTMAKIYSDQTKLSDVLREENFNNKYTNRLSYLVASGVDGVEAVCAFLNLIQDGADAHKNFKKALGGGSLKSAFSKFVSDKKADPWGTTKSLLLGDLYQRSWQRRGDLSPVETVQMWHKIAKGAEGLVDRIDKLNKGELSFAEFSLAQGLEGLNQVLFKNQNSETKDFLGRENDFSKFVELPIHITKNVISAGILLAGGNEKSTLYKLVEPEKSYLGRIADFSQSIKSLDVNLVGKVEIPDISCLQTKVNLTKSSFIMPELSFTLNINKPSMARAV